MDQSSGESEVTQIILPGDVVPVDSETDIVLGPGLRQEGETIVATKAGFLKHIPTGNRWWIDSNQKRYIASTGESVLGTVIAKLTEHYRVDIGAAGFAILPVLAFEGATKKNRPKLNLHTLVYCRVALANRDMEPELECTNPATAKADGFGELNGGFVFQCSLGLCRRLLDPSTPILSLLSNHFPFEMAVGMNGRVWINAKKEEDTILIANAIQNSEYLSTGECKSMVESLLNRA